MMGFFDHFNDSDLCLKMWLPQDETCRPRDEKAGVQAVTTAKAFLSYLGGVQQAPLVIPARLSNVVKRPRSVS